MQNRSLITLDEDQKEIPPVGPYLAAVGFLGFSSKTDGSGPQT